jgi:hypothetical protein
MIRWMAAGSVVTLLHSVTSMLMVVVEVCLLNW